MKIVKPMVIVPNKLTQYKLDNPDEVIDFLANGARISYQSFEKKNGIETEERLIKNCIKNGHTSVLEHESLTFDFITSRGCYDELTKVLTDSGWKYFDDVDIDKDLICTIDENDNLKYVKAVNKIKYFYEGKMHHYTSTQLDLNVTPDHRMWVSPWDIRRRNEDGSRKWMFMPSEEMNSKRYIFNKSSNGKVNSLPLSQLIIPAVQRKAGSGRIYYPGFIFRDEKLSYFLELLGIWLTDGSVSYGVPGSGNRIEITQIKEHVRIQIEFLLNELHIPYRKHEKGFRLNSPALFDWLVENFIDGRNMRKTYYMRIPRWMFRDLNKYQLDCFLRGLFLGNGSIHTQHTDKMFNFGFVIYTGSKMFTEDLLELGLLTGRCANVWVYPPSERTFPDGHVSNCKESYVVSFSLRAKKHVWKRDVGKAKKTEEWYYGYVYCLELESDHRLFVMRNGKSCWCGNCSHELVRHRIASYVQESTRYVKYENGEMEFIRPIFSNTDMYDVWFQNCLDCETAYIHMREAGAQPQEAREVLNNSFKTQIRITRNFRAMREFLSLRCAKPAHPHIKEICIPLLLLLKQKFPIIFDDIKYDEEFLEKMDDWHTYIKEFVIPVKYLEEGEH